VAHQVQEEYNSLPTAQWHNAQTPCHKTAETT